VFKKCVVLITIYSECVPMAWICGYNFFFLYKLQISMVALFITRESVHELTLEPTVRKNIILG